MDLDAYVAEHRGEWRRLAVLSGKFKLSGAEADELVLLYQRVATQLSVVQSRTPDPALVAELSRLVLTARAALTGPSRFDWRSVPRFLFQDLPHCLYVARRWWVLCGLSFCLVGGIMIAWVAGNPGVPSTFGIDQRDIDRLVEGEFTGYYSELLPQNFGLRVWANNAFLAATCLASGILVFPPILLLWTNAVSIGLVGGVMGGAGHGDTFFMWIAPHGFLELTAIFVAAGIGMRMGWSWVEPGPVLTRAQSLAVAAKQGMVGTIGLAGVLAVSALLEAFLTPSPLPLIVRGLIGFLVWSGFLGYVWLLGSARARALQILHQP